MIRTTTFMVTPFAAKEFLSKNTSNRKMDHGRVAAYASAMERGAWEVNGQGIVIDSNGNLKDGQHRLAAIIKYGKPVMMTVTFGVSPNTHMYDRGRSRSTVDNMRIAGYSKHLANQSAVSIAKAHFARTENNVYIADDAVISFINKYSNEIELIVSLCQNASRKTGYARTQNANIMYPLFCALLSGVPYSTISEFVSIVKDGLCYEKNKTSAVVLRNDILGGVVTGTGLPDRKRSMAIVCRALKDFVRGVSRSLSYKNVSLEDETYMDTAFGGVAE